MLLGVDKAQNLELSILPVQRWAALTFGAGSLAVLTAFIVNVREPVTGAESVGGIATGSENVRLLARSLFSDYVYAFELTSLLLVIAVIGAVVLARKPKDTEMVSSDSERSI